jgi:hypothetical protein
MKYLNNLFFSQRSADLAHSLLVPARQRSELVFLANQSDPSKGQTAT